MFFPNLESSYNFSDLYYDLCYGSPKLPVVNHWFKAKSKKSRFLVPDIIEVRAPSRATANQGFIDFCSGSFFQFFCSDAGDKKSPIFISRLKLSNYFIYIYIYIFMYRFIWT